MSRQLGVALLLTLLMMICVMLIGVSAAQMALEGEKAARAARDGHVAFQAAEDALSDAEKDIASAGGPHGGLVARAASGQTPAWQRIDLTGAVAGDEGSVEYGSFTGAEMETGQGFQPFRRPRYIIERMECHQPGEDASAGAPPKYCYRVTAIGFGAKPGTQLVLQSVYRRKE